MGAKFGLLLGPGTGYVFGTRVGREQYERIRLAISKIYRFPVVARPLDSAGEKVFDMVRARGECITDKATGAVEGCPFGAPATPREVDLCFEDEGPNSH